MSVKWPSIQTFVFKLLPIFYKLGFIIYKYVFIDKSVKILYNGGQLHVALRHC